jgi:creatinine amidohydrolase
MQPLEKLTATEISQLLHRGVTAVVVPFGSIERHGGHLPVGTDALLADAVGSAVAERLGAALAPTQRVGDADRHMGCAGTITLGAETLTAVAVAIGRSLVRQGFRLVVLLSTHGGNDPSLAVAVEQLNAALPEGSGVCAPRGAAGPSPGTHSGAWITSVMLALHPDLVDLRSADCPSAADLRAADARLGYENLERFVASVVREARQAADS